MSLKWCTVPMSRSPSTSRVILERQMTYGQKKSKYLLSSFDRASSVKL